MLKRYLQIETLSSVFLGNFNPTIVQPYWLASKGLIRELEAEEATVEVIHPQIVRYSLGWVSIEVTQNRFELKTSKSPYFEVLRDLAISIFKILNETPLKGLGINHIYHYAVPDDKTYYDIGNKLVPLSNWDFLNDPRLLQLEILEDQRNDDFKGKYRVKIYPSDQKLSTKYGITLGINDHFDSKSENSGANFFVTLLSEQWQESFKRANEVKSKLEKLITHE